MPFGAITNKRSNGVERHSQPTGATPADTLLTLVTISDAGVVHELQNNGVPICRVRGDGRMWAPVLPALPATPVAGDIWLETIAGQDYLRYCDSGGTPRTLGIGGGPAPIPASDVTYTNAQWPLLATADDALSQLLYITPTISAFTVLAGGQALFEPGDTATNPALSWARNKDVVSQALVRNPGAVAIPLIPGQVAYNDVLVVTNAVPATVDYTLTIDDGTNVSARTESLTWVWSQYYGLNANAALTNPMVLALTKDFAQTKGRTLSALVCGGAYFYWLWPDIPAFAGTPMVTVNGMAFTAFNETSQVVTNAFGEIQTYRVFRTEYLQNGTLDVVIA